MKGFCIDCLFIRQEWTIAGTSQQELVLDRYCWLYDVFKKADGYCDYFEEK